MMHITDAVREGELETVRAYLGHGGDPYLAINTGSTLLMIAATYGQADAALLLIGAGADVNTVNYDGLTALMYSTMRTGNIKTVELLVRSGADVNVSFPRSNSAGTTALLMAAGAGQTKIALLLLKSGADINARDNYGDTAMALAVRHGFTETAEMLKSFGTV